VLCSWVRGGAWRCGGHVSARGVALFMWGGGGVRVCLVGAVEGTIEWFGCDILVAVPMPILADDGRV